MVGQQLPSLARPSAEDSPYIAMLARSLACVLMPLLPYALARLWITFTGFSIEPVHKDADSMARWRGALAEANPDMVRGCARA